MKPIRSNPERQRKLARLIAFTSLVLAWIGTMLFGDEKPISRRHVRQRYAWLNLNVMARVIAHLVLARAVAFAPRLPKRTQRNYAGAGFTRSIGRSHVLRTLIGSRLRKSLKHPDVATRFARLLDALRNIDALARQLAHRLRKGRTRVSPIIAVRPPHDALRCVAPAYACEAADSS